MNTLEASKVPVNQEYPAAFLLASLVCSYPDENFSEYVRTVLDNPEAEKRLDEASPKSWPLVRSYLLEIVSDSEALRELQALYVEVFERVRPGVSLYETEYGLGRSLAKGPELLDIARYYEAFGFTMGDENSSYEMVDHLAVELEFYALMGMKLQALALELDEEGVSIVDEGRRNFMKNHLGTFSRSILARETLQISEFYFQAINCIDDLISQECQRLGIEQNQKEWQDNLLTEEEEMTCGATGCLSGKTPAPQSL